MGEEVVCAKGATFFVSYHQSAAKKPCELLCDLMAWDSGGVAKWSVVRVWVYGRHLRWRITGCEGGVGGEESLERRGTSCSGLSALRARRERKMGLLQCITINCWINTLSDLNY